jgi:hypothetical protein
MKELDQQKKVKWKKIIDENLNLQTNFDGKSFFVFAFICFTGKYKYNGNL